MNVLLRVSAVCTSLQSRATDVFMFNEFYEEGRTKRFTFFYSNVKFQSVLFFVLNLS